jgi:hypothetical protein
LQQSVITKIDENFRALETSIGIESVLFAIYWPAKLQSTINGESHKSQGFEVAAVRK